MDRGQMATINRMKDLLLRYSDPHGGEVPPPLRPWMDEDASNTVAMLVDLVVEELERQSPAAEIAIYKIGE